MTPQNNDDLSNEQHRQPGLETANAQKQHTKKTSDAEDTLGDKKPGYEIPLDETRATEEKNNPEQAMHEAMEGLNLMKLDKWSTGAEPLVQTKHTKASKVAAKTKGKSNDKNEATNISLRNINGGQKTAPDNTSTVQNTMDNVSWLRDLHRREEEFKSRMTNMHKRQIERKKKEEEEQLHTDRLNEEEEKQRLVARHAEGEVISNA